MKQRTKNALSAIAISAAFFALGACPNPSSSPAAGTEPSLDGVLCVGEAEDGTPCYWDGSTTAVSLATFGEDASVEAIARFGSSVVAAGSYYDDAAGADLPCQWDGAGVSALPVPNDAVEGYAYSVAVDGQDVYVGGGVWIDGTRRPALWKNKELQTAALPDDCVSGWIYAVAATNGSVYAAGQYTSASDMTRAFGLGASGAFDLSIPDDAIAARAYGVAVSGSSVRIVGYYRDSNYEEIPCWWDENGARTDASIPTGFLYATVKSAAYIDADLYICGTVQNTGSASSMRAAFPTDGGDGVYCVWKDGEPTLLQAPDGYDFASYTPTVQNANGLPAIVGQVIDSTDVYYNCAWVDGTPFIIGPSNISIYN